MPIASCPCEWAPLREAGSTFIIPSHQVVVHVDKTSLGLLQAEQSQLSQLLPVSKRLQSLHNTYGSSYQKNKNKTKPAQNKTKQNKKVSKKGYLRAKQVFVSNTFPNHSPISQQKSFKDRQHLNIVLSILYIHGPTTS